MCGPIGRREIFLTSSLLVEIEGHFSLEFVNYVCETEDWSLLQWSPKVCHVFTKVCLLLSFITVGAKSISCFQSMYFLEKISQDSGTIESFSSKDLSDENRTKKLNIFNPLYGHLGLN
jgi:hypothetical protein